VTTDLHELIETGLGDGPPHPPVADRVAAGRRAVRRRRRRTVAGSAAAMLTAAGLALALVGSHSDAGGGPAPVPQPPKATATPIPVRLMVAPADYVSADTPPVLYLYGRMFKRAHDVTVLATYGEIDHSTSHPRGAAIVRVGGRTEWVVIVGNEPEREVAEKAGPYSYQQFAAYAELELPMLSGHLALAATAPGPYAPPVSDADSPAEFDGTLLVAKPGGTVVQRIRHPVASAQSVPPCHAQGVRIHRPDQDWFVLGFDCRGRTGLYSEQVGVRADTLSTWLARVKRVQDEFAA
jgi:hypothetical protein